MSDQEKAGRLMTFEEFAPQCVVAADCWLKAHPQDPQCDWDNTYGLIHSLRDCIQRGTNQLQRERKEPEPLTVNQLIAMDGKMLYLVDDLPNHYTKYTGWVVLRVRTSDTVKDVDFRVFEIWSDKIPREYIGDTKHGIITCMKIYEHEPKGEHHD